MSELLRSCSGCSAHILTADGRSEDVYCPRCAPKHATDFATWAAGLKAGDRVFIQPYLDPPFARSTWIVRQRDGDQVKISVLGLPDHLIATDIAQLADRCMARRAG